MQQLVLIMHLNIAYRIISDTWMIIVIFNVHLALGSAHDIDGPRNTVVFAGQPMEMECQAESNSTVSEWSMQRPFTSDKRTIFVNFRSQRKVKIEHFGIVEDTTGLVILYTNWTNLDDAGIYTCAVQKTLKQPERYSAHLIVLETEPICETNFSTPGNNTFEEGTQLWMRCTVNFTGSWTPTMEWRLHEGNLGTDEEATVYDYDYDYDLTDRADAEIVSNAGISSTLIIALAATSNSSYYSCKIYFPSVNSSELVTARNSPDYSFIWKSPMVTSMPNPVIPTTQWKRMINNEPASNMNDLKPTFNASNAIYLVAGVAVLFGIASSLAALILCHRLRRKNFAAMETIDRTELAEGEYDLIPYACSDGYDTIGEVNDEDDTLATIVPPRLDPLPSPHYSGLGPIEYRPPGVYSRMDHKEKAAENKENGIGLNEQHISQERPTPDQSKLPETEDSTRINNYLSLETNAHYDSAADSEAYLEVKEDCWKMDSECSGYETTKKEDPIRKLAPVANNYEELVTKSDSGIEEECDKTQSSYYNMTEDRESV